MLIVFIILVVVTLILLLYWFFVFKTYRNENDLIGIVYGIPLTVMGIAIYVIIFSQLADWRL